MPQYKREVWSGYCAFYLMDAEAGLHREGLFEQVDWLIREGASFVVVETARNSTLIVCVDIVDAAPSLEGLDDWDVVNECSLSLPTGVLEVAGMTDFCAEEDRIFLAPDDYRVRVCYSTLYDWSEGQEDRYAVILWPAKEAPIQVIKAPPR